MMRLKAMVLLGMFLAVCAPVQADQFVEEFEEGIDFLADGVGKSGWDGFLGLGPDETADALNASVTAAGQLYIESTNARYQDPWTPLGPFLYKMVEGDFMASVLVSDYQDVLHNNCGIMARVPSDVATGGEDWVSIDYFPIWNCGNFVRSANDGGRTENGHNGLAFGLDPYLQLERVGNTFHFRTSTDGVVWTDMAQSPLVRDDMDGLAVQVGLFQATYSGDTGYVAFDDFILEGDSVVSKRGDGAYKPAPNDGIDDVEHKSVLSWTPGLEGRLHTLYLGEDVNAVTDATVAEPLGVLVSLEQDVNVYVPEVPLEFGRTYYWRVDDINTTPDQTVVKGRVWSFMVEPEGRRIEGVSVTASSSFASSDPNLVIDGSGLDENELHSTNLRDMWFSDVGTGEPQWLVFEFDRAYKLHELLVWNSNQVHEGLFGFGMKDVAIEYSLDGVEWTLLKDVVFEKGSTLPGYAANTQVDLEGVVAQYVKLLANTRWGNLLDQTSLSEVRFSYIPAEPWLPQPVDGAAQVDPGTVLTWRAGRDANSHEVLVSTDREAVAQGTAPMATVEGNTYDLTEFDAQLDTTYYWKVNAISDGAYASDIWSFSTVPVVIVDDFERYGNLSPDRPFQTWLDGFGYSADDFFPVGYGGNGTGSGVGHDIWSLASPHYNGDIMERSNVLSGRQSMPFTYDNTGGGSSQIDRKWAVPQDWSGHGITTLVVNVSGHPANTGSALYAVINGQKVTCPDAGVLASQPWTPWSIDLAALNVDLGSITSLSLGVEGTGAGVLYLDDLALHVSGSDVVESVDPGTAGMTAKFSLENNLDDTSGNGLGTGTATGMPIYVDGLVGNGKALSFNGVDDFVELPVGFVIGASDSITISCWADFSNEGGAWQRLWDFGSGDGANPYMFLCPRVNTGGPVRFAIRSQTIGEQILEGPGTLASGWQHVAVTIDSDTSQMKLYVNGTVVAEGVTQVIPSDLGDTTQNYLGNSQWPDALYQGVIDEVLMYNRPLSHGEIRYLAGDR